MFLSLVPLYKRTTVSSYSSSSSTSTLSTSWLTVHRRSQRYNSTYHTLPLTLWSERLETVRNKLGYIVDMDGVLTRGNELIPGAADFLNWLRKGHKQYLFLTNSSDKSPQMIRQKFLNLGVEISAEAFFTSAMATADFVYSQKPDASAFVIGEPILKEELVKKGIKISEEQPDYVIMGETKHYDKRDITLASNLVHFGSKLIGTNKDLYDAIENGNIEPSTGSWISVIEKATKVEAYFVGKPNPLMARTALNRLGLHTKDCAVIGDRMDTDIIAGVESMIDTVLVLSGVTKLHELEGKNTNRWAWTPYIILDHVGCLLPTK
eukprot:TRINITY_DN4499_c0_g1_i1.p1 TRINITY_DN4499_c0_g1~~TRINITY_DN4499_c0_g1_i1.p1  ORF type:complete len:321 (+),score=43.60 TRINITY_DN4499_c0_g1_i1:98-1060(+)